ncbi:hypothetical protein HYALB_00013510 [Hymenoscyphus albidus]|uniref:Uncharacterized protein n=1 Tax=Hymenoscyphus albidus TaxID=595503 RepID=A0A9N9LTB5_9HELO|nr:hypothetical protein HYALB_00013510 [Hymenoscyphus albidus]
MLAQAMISHTHWAAQPPSGPNRCSANVIRQTPNERKADKGIKVVVVAAEEAHGLLSTPNSTPKYTRKL